MRARPGEITASNTPMKNLKAMKPDHECVGTYMIVMNDHIIEQKARYFALGRRWTRNEDGNIPQSICNRFSTQCIPVRKTYQFPVLNESLRAFVEAVWGCCSVLYDVQHVQLSKNIVCNHLHPKKSCCQSSCTAARAYDYLFGIHTAMQWRFAPVGWRDN